MHLAAMEPRRDALVASRLVLGGNRDSDAEGGRQQKHQYDEQAESRTKFHG